MKKRVVSILLSTMVVAGLFAGCGTSGDDSSSASSSDTKTEAPAEDKADDAKEASDTATAGGNVVGVVMPTKDLQRWNQDGQNMEQQTEGRRVRSRYSVLQ